MSHSLRLYDTGYKDGYEDALKATSYDKYRAGYKAGYIACKRDFTTICLLLFPALSLTAIIFYDYLTGTP
jgi:hypothetical protein